MPTPKEPLYSLRVEDNSKHTQLLQIVGERDTVLDMALRVILDSSPDDWRFQPAFTIYAYKVK